MSIQQELEAKLKEWGSTFVGFSNVSEKLPESLKKYPYAITFGIRLSDAIINEIDNVPTFSYFHHYRTVNALIDYISLRVTCFLQEKGFSGYTIGASQSIPNAPIPYSGVFPHKTAAVMAGLGWIGKNGLLISNDYGPSVRLGTILTDMELVVNSLNYQNKCGDCRRCVDACPAMALTGDNSYPELERDTIVDAKACSEHMSSKYKHIGRGSVCGICIAVCPYRCGKL